MPECNLKNETCGFRCTGFEGQDTWKKIHKIAKDIPCESCSDHAQILMSGIHDHVNAGLGKKPFNKQNYKKFIDEVNCVWNTCKEQGRC